MSEIMRVSAAGDRIITVNLSGDGGARFLLKKPRLHEYYANATIHGCLTEAVKRLKCYVVEIGLAYFTNLVCVHIYDYVYTIYSTGFDQWTFEVKSPDGETRQVNCDNPFRCLELLFKQLDADIQNIQAYCEV